jgi:hypothetical protein
MIGTDRHRRILKLEAMTEDQVEVALGEVPEALLELTRVGRLDVGHRGSQLVADPSEALEGRCVPTSV